MGFVIGQECVDVTDMSCVAVCPVDCIYQGDRKAYIHPDECIDCGACEAECPVNAIAPDRRLKPENFVHKEDNRVFFETVLPNRAEPLGSPGGADDLGPVGVDTPLVAALPRVVD